LSAYAADLKISTKTGRTLLRLVRAAQPIPRVELARRLNINRSTVSEIFKPLIAAGILCEAQVRSSPGKGRLAGRPALGLSFCSEREIFAGVNIGVRRSQIGLTTLNNQLLAEEDFDTPSEEKPAMALVRANVEQLCRRFPDRDLKVIGVSVPGPTDRERRKLLYAPRLGWRDVAVAEALKFRSSRDSKTTAETIPVIVENDATAAAMYEARLRLRNMVGGLLNDFVLVRSGTGIGVGLVLAGEVYRGKGEGQGIAGEFGHMTIVAGGKPCVCGNRGCWEQYASASAASSLYMGDRVQMGWQKAPRFVDIVAKAESGEVRAQRTLERVGEYLGIGISNVITGLGVPQVIVSGRLVYGWKFIEKSLREAIGQSMAGKLSGWSVEPGEPTGAGLGGALEVAAEEYLAYQFSG
jgi:predicted NBD/HSP70 family sugar kinase